MAVTIHAILLLAVSIATAILCIAGPRRRPPTPGRATILAGGVTLLVLGSSAHLCKAGDPFTQCIITGTSLWFLLTFAGNRGVRIGLSIAMVAIMIGLSIQYVDLVHSPAWRGHPYPSIAVRAKNALLIARIRTGLNDPQLAGSTCPEGWLRDTPLASHLQEQLSDTPFRIEVHWAWHSWYTRLFPVRRIDQDFWITGGRLPECADSVSLRDRR